jgi:nuclear protein localization protein 4 homolog
MYSVQDEEALLCKVAAHGDLAESFQLRSTPGWQTLYAILQSTGERIPKRPRDDDLDTSVDGSDKADSRWSRFGATPDERLAKRFAAVRLKDDRPA